MRWSLWAWLLWAGAGYGQEWNLRPNDTALVSEALHARLNGQTITFYDDGQSEYYTDGRYTYTYANDGGTAYGYWQLEPGGIVCIDFVNGRSRCDMFVRNETRLVLLTAQGDRFPIRP